MKTSYPPDVKARAITALLVGERPRIVAREYGIPESTVTTWRHRLKNGKLRHKKKDGGLTLFGELLVEHLEASLRSLIAKTEHLAEPALLREMGAHRLAVLYGSLFDQTIRMLELLLGSRSGRGEGVLLDYHLHGY
jgi:transposase-like protein